MKAISSYSEVEPVIGYEKVKLPPGGYILTIKKAEEVSGNGWEAIEISFDISEGEYKGFYAAEYRSQREEFSPKKWKGTHKIFIPQHKGDDDKYKNELSRFKGQIEAFNKSNNGLKIDCSKDWNVDILKSKTVGALFGEEEYYNKYTKSNDFCTKLFYLVDVETIRTEAYSIPKPKLLKQQTTTAAAEFNPNDFEEIIGDGDLPF